MSEPNLTTIIALCLGFVLFVLFIMLVIAVGNIDRNLNKITKHLEQREQSVSPSLVGGETTSESGVVQESR